MSQGRDPLQANSTIRCRVESGSGRPLTNAPPNWFTPLWPAPTDATLNTAGVGQLAASLTSTPVPHSIFLSRINSLLLQKCCITTTIRLYIPKTFRASKIPISRVQQQRVTHTVTKGYMKREMNTFRDNFLKILLLFAGTKMEITCPLNEINKIFFNKW